MKSKKSYSPKQLANVDRTMGFLSSLPEEQQSMAVMFANVFLAGMEAQAKLTGHMAAERLGA